MNERLSGWMDGELKNGQARQLVSQVKCDVDIRGNWGYYHLIGDILRGMQGPELCARICARLDAEPAVLALQHCSRAKKLGWFASAAAASVAVMAFVAFVGGITLPGSQENSPKIDTIPATESFPPPAPADGSVRGHLFAHQEYSPSNALQGVSVYMRTISQEVSPAIDR